MEAYCANNNQETMFRLYRGTTKIKGLQSHVKQEWEKEGHLTLSSTKWDNICKVQWKTKQLEFCWKNLLRLQ